jgi:hypothetical protein
LLFCWKAVGNTYPFKAHNVWYSSAGLQTVIR